MDAFQQARAEEARKWATGLCSAHPIPQAECEICNLQLSFGRLIYVHLQVFQTLVLDQIGNRTELTREELIQIMKDVHRRYEGWKDK